MYRRSLYYERFSKILVTLIMRILSKTKRFKIESVRLSNLLLFLILYTVLVCEREANAMTVLLFLETSCTCLITA